MKTLGICAAALAVFATPAHSESRYDRKLEQAAKAIVAAKMGSIRGGFDYNQRPAIVVIYDQVTTGSIVGGGLRLTGQDVSVEQPAPTERTVSRIILF